MPGGTAVLWIRGQAINASMPGTVDMTHELLSVHGPAERDEFGSYGSKEVMEEAFAATGAFNDKLHADGYWVFAGGLQTASSTARVRRR